MDESQEQITAQNVIYEIYLNVGIALLLINDPTQRHNVNEARKELCFLIEQALKNQNEKD